MSTLRATNIKHENSANNNIVLDPTGSISVREIHVNGEQLHGGVGIATGGGYVGGGATVIDFRGPGISTITLSSGVATVNITGGGGSVGLSTINVVNDTSTNSTGYLIFTSSTSGSISTTNVSNTKLQFNPSSGNLSATNFTSLSDKSKKTNIKPIENPIQIVKNIEGVRYNWIDNNNPSIGVIAQDIEKVIPEVVNINSDGLKSVSYGNIVGVLIEAIKEQQKQIDDLVEQVNHLKNK